MKSRKCNFKACVAFNVLFLLSVAVTVARAGETCKDSAGNTPCSGTNTPCVCVERADLNDPPPVEGFDFAFDVFTDPSNPDVWFKTGSSTIPWRVWSQVSASDTTSANLGDLFIDSTGTTDNYKVELKNPNTGGAGAANVGWIALADADKKWTGWSSITGGSISGDLTYLEVVQVAGHRWASQQLHGRPRHISRPQDPRGGFPVDRPECSSLTQRWHPG